MSIERGAARCRCRTTTAGARISASFRVPQLGGDTVYTLSLASSGGHRTAVPVTVRTLVPTTGAAGVFGGWLLYRLVETPFMRLRARWYPAAVPEAKTPTCTGWRFS